MQIVSTTLSLRLCDRGNRRRKNAPDHREMNGFTLLELLVVIAILALLAGIVGSQVIGYLGGAKTDTARIQQSNIEASLDLYRLDAGQYPGELKALVERPSDAKRWNGPYLKKASGLFDPWGELYQYRFPGQHGAYDLFTLGADGAEGGDGENQDVKNW